MWLADRGASLSKETTNKQYLLPWWLKHGRQTVGVIQIQYPPLLPRPSTPKASTPTHYCNKAYSTKTIQSMDNKKCMFLQRITSLQWALGLCEKTGNVWTIHQDTETKRKQFIARCVCVCVRYKYVEWLEPCRKERLASNKNDVLEDYIGMNKCCMYREWLASQPAS